MKNFYTLILLLATTIVTYAQSGTLDTSFGDQGIAKASAFAGYNYAEATLVQEDGKILVAGNAGFSSNYQMAIARFNADGTLDSSFGDDGTMRFPVGSVKSFIMDLKQQPDGKILIGGYTWDNTQADLALVRLNLDGSFDTSFGIDGISHLSTSSTDTGEKIALLEDGKILFGGYKDNNFSVARFNADGSLDTSFGNEGFSVTVFQEGSSYMKDIAVQNDDKIVANGFVLNGDNRYQIAAIRLNADGTADNSFAANGKTLFSIGEWNDFSTAMTLQEDGKILVGGHKWIMQLDQRHDFFIVRLNVDGSLDTSYGVDGVAVARVVDGANYSNAMVIQEDGKPILVGNTIFEGAYNMAMARFTTEGNLDTTFGADANGMVRLEAIGIEDYALAVDLQADDKIVLGGYAYNVGADDSDLIVARFHNDGTMGVENNTFAEIRLFPNPASETLTIQLKNLDSSNLEIVDVLGKTVFASEITQTQNINVSALAPGIYFAKISAQGKNEVLRFVKK